LGLTIAVEGAYGDAGRRLYLPALQPFVGNRISQLVLVDVRQAPGALRALASKDGRIQLINKRSSTGRKILGRLKADVVFVVTPPREHLGVGLEWLGRAGRIIIEKPATIDADGLDQLENAAEAASSEILLYDHYRARVLSFLDQIGGLELPPLIGTKFFLLEAFTIEQTARFGGLEDGAVFDLLPHFFNSIALFTGPAPIKISRAFGAQYSYDGRLPAIPSETLGWIKGKFNVEPSCNFEAVVGFATGRMDLAGLRPLKTLQLSFRDSVTITLDFVDLTAHGVGIRHLNIEREPYRRLIESLVEFRPLRHEWFVDWRTARWAIDSIGLCHSAVQSAVPNTYRAGTSIDMIGAHSAHGHP
jgi:hypothetical protein